MSLFQITRSNSLPIRALTWTRDTCVVARQDSLSVLLPHIPVLEPDLHTVCLVDVGWQMASLSLSLAFQCCQKPSDPTVLMIIISPTSITHSSHVTFQSLAFYLHLIPSSHGWSFRNCRVAICHIRPCLPSVMGLVLLPDRSQSGSNIPS